MARATITRKVQVVATPEPGTPEWRQGMSVGQWKEIPGTSFADVPIFDSVEQSMRTPNGRIDAWNGLALNRANGDVYLARAGGHADWHGNEVYKLVLAADEPAWAVIRQPTPAEDILWGSSYYADGRPSSTHLYYALHHCPQRGRLFTYYSGSLWGSGNEANSNVDAFRLEDNDWDAEGTYDATPGSGTVSDRPMCQDPRSSDVYTTTGGYYRRWRESDATWEQLGPIQSGSGGDIHSASPSAVDTTRDRVLFARNSYRVAQLQGAAVDQSTGLAQEVTFSGARAADVVAAVGCGMEYIEPLDVYLLKTRTAGDLIQIDAETLVATTRTTSGGSSIPGSANGNYTRFKYVPSLGGCIYLPRHASNLWFLALE